MTTKGPGITVVIPTIPPRVDRLATAFASVATQERPADRIVVVNDIDARGAAWTRTQGLMMVDTEWTAFLDDDDELLPEHLGALEDHASQTGADMVFPWFTVVGGQDPFPQHFGRQFDLADPHQTTITMLVRTDLAQRIGGFLEPGEGELDQDGNRAGEDFRFVCRLAEAGAVIRHLPERTWIWNHWGRNLSGRPWRQAVAR